MGKYTGLVMKREAIRVRPPDVAQFNRPARTTFRWFWKWWDRWRERLWWSLGKPWDDVTVQVRHVRIDRDAMLQVISEQAGSIERILNEHAKHVVVGWEQFHQVAAEVAEMDAYQRAMHFEVEARLGRGREICVVGLHVHVIPWFDGVLVLPGNIVWEQDRVTL